MQVSSLSQGAAPSLLACSCSSWPQCCNSAAAPSHSAAADLAGARAHPLACLLCVCRAASVGASGALPTPHVAALSGRGGMRVYDMLPSSSSSSSSGSGSSSGEESDEIEGAPRRKRGRRRKAGEEDYALLSSSDEDRGASARKARRQKAAKKKKKKKKGKESKRRKKEKRER